jgi:hypothetical protein
MKDVNSLHPGAGGGRARERRAGGRGDWEGVRRREDLGGREGQEGRPGEERERERERERRRGERRRGTHPG